MTQPAYDTNVIIEDLKTSYGDKITTPDIRAYCISKGYNYNTVTKKLEAYKINRGRWDLQVTPEVVESMEKIYNSSHEEYDSENDIAPKASSENELIPEKDPNFIRFGNYPDIKKIIKSEIFYPTFITGLSGNGKTCGVEQACADLQRELIRVNITIETDEDDLIGGFRLVNGETVWSYGPVVTALKRGAILLLDEIDLASNKIMCLQSILEGKGVYLKKTNEMIHPTPGFNIIATANTKGKGSEDGKFIGTNILNEAFLERFALTFEQEYPNVKTEIRILKKLAQSLGITNDSNIDLLCENLANWGDLIRKSYYEGAVDEIVSTRRLVHIIKAYKIFGSSKKAIEVCLNRFDKETKDSFIDYYSKIEKTNKPQDYDNTGNFFQVIPDEMDITSVTTPNKTSSTSVSSRTLKKPSTQKTIVDRKELVNDMLSSVNITSAGSGYIDLNNNTAASDEWVKYSSTVDFNKMIKDFMSYEDQKLSS